MIKIKITKHTDEVEKNLEEMKDLITELRFDGANADEIYGKFVKLANNVNEELENTHKEVIKGKTKTYYKDRFITSTVNTAGTVIGGTIGYIILSAVFDRMIGNN